MSAGAPGACTSRSIIPKRIVAVAVAEAAAAEGVARVELDDIVQQVQDAMWQPEYCRIQAA